MSTDTGTHPSETHAVLPLAALTDAVVILDRGWRYLYVNEKAAGLFGRAAADLVGRHIWAVFPDGVGQPFHRAYERVLATGIEEHFEAYYEPWDRWFENRVFPTADGVLILFTETTQARRARKALELSEARFRSLSASSPVGIFMSDGAGHVTYANARAAEIWAMSEEELLGEGWTTRVHPDDLPRALARWRAARAADEPHDKEFRLRLPDGAVRWIRARSAPLHDASGAEVGAVGTVEDVTEQRVLERQLRQAQKLEAVGRLAGGIAHDFNNLLTVIHGNLEFITHDLPSDSAVRAHLDEIASAARRARALVRQLLAFSRTQVLAVRRLDVNAVVRDAERLLRPLIGEEIALHVAGAAEPLLVEADAGQLEQVLVNLAINARDAMLTPMHGHPGRGGALTIEVDAVTLSSAEAGEWTPLDPGRYVRVTVRDTGHGMDQEATSHAFEPFFTTKQVGEGTGLGLATVYGIVTQSGGAVRLASAPGAGATFTILLPRVDEVAVSDEASDGSPEGARDASGAHVRPRPERGGTVLLVEDELAVRTAARLLLERHGYTVLEARHGADALLVWRERRAEVTVVVTDVRMPELGGPELVAMLRAEAPDLPVVYVSGYPARAGSALSGSREVFLAKPFTGEELLGAIDRALDGRS